MGVIPRKVFPQIWDLFFGEVKECHPRSPNAETWGTRNLWKNWLLEFA